MVILGEYILFSMSLFSALFKMNLYCVYNERFSNATKEQDVHTKAEVNMQGTHPSLNTSQTALLSKYSLDNMRYSRKAQNTQDTSRIKGLSFAYARYC